MLFEAYSKQDPAKALAFAKEMRAVSAWEWTPVAAYQQSVIDVRELIADGKSSAALDAIANIKKPRDYYIDAFELESLKLEAIKASGNTAQVYESLLAMESMASCSPELLVPALRAVPWGVCLLAERCQEVCRPQLSRLRDTPALGMEIRRPSNPVYTTSLQRLGSVGPAAVGAARRNPERLEQEIATMWRFTRNNRITEEFQSPMPSLDHAASWRTLSGHSDATNCEPTAQFSKH